MEEVSATLLHQPVSRSDDLPDSGAMGFWKDVRRYYLRSTYVCTMYYVRVRVKDAVGPDGSLWLLDSNGFGVQGVFGKDRERNCADGISILRYEVLRR